MSDRIDRFMDTLERQKEELNRAEDRPHPDRKNAYRWTYPCRACGQMMTLTWDSSDGYPSDQRLYHNCENTILANEDDDIGEPCGAYHVFPLDYWIEIDLKGGVLSCERTDEPLATCGCVACAERRTRDAGRVAATVATGARPEDGPGDRAGSGDR